jgi:hypothetical protein
MRLVDTKVALSFPLKVVLAKATEGDSLGLAEPDNIWESEREVIRTAFRELLGFFLDIAVEHHQTVA